MLYKIFLNIALIRGRAVFLSMISMLFYYCSSKNNSNSIDTTPIYGCKEPKLRQIYFLRSCNIDVCGYTHTLMLNSYMDSCFNDYDFVAMADKYLDSVQKQLPVRGIIIAKPFDSNPLSTHRIMSL